MTPCDVQVRLEFLRREIICASADDTVLQAAVAHHVGVQPRDELCEPPEAYIASALKPRKSTTLASLLTTGREMSKSDDPMDGMKSARSSRKSSRRTTPAVSRRPSGGSLDVSVAASSSLRGISLASAAVSSRRDSHGSAGSGSGSGLTRLDTVSDFTPLGLREDSSLLESTAGPGFTDMSIVIPIVEELGEGFSDVDDDDDNAGK